MHISWKAISGCLCSCPALFLLLAGLLPVGCKNPLRHGFEIEPRPYDIGDPLPPRSLFQALILQGRYNSIHRFLHKGHGSRGYSLRNRYEPQDQKDHKDKALPHSFHFSL